MEEKINLKIADLTKLKTADKRPEKLNDEDLDKVAGGYWEYDGYATDFWIECPNCHRKKREDFNTWMDHEQRVDQFRCKCGYAFAVDENGVFYGAPV